MPTIGYSSNISSIRAQRTLASQTSSLSATLERLASGSRINRAGDDAAGLAIQSSLKKDVRVYTQAIRNGNDAISAISIAEGNLGQLSNVLIRMKELAVQTANGTFSRTQRISLDKEGEALTAEFNRVVASASFNGLRLLDGQLGTLNIQLGYGRNGSIGFGMGSDISRNIGNGTYTGDYDATFAGLGHIVTDWDGDGINDIVSVDETNKIFFAKGTGNGAFDGETQIATGSGGLFTGVVQAGDMNGDGRIDLVANLTGNQFQVIYSDGAGGATTSGPISFGGSSGSKISLGDFNNDGFMDVFGSGLATGRLVLGSASGGFQSAQSIALGVIFNDVEFADLNDDGKLDLIGAASTGTINVMLGNGSGTFQSAIASAFSTDTSRIAIGDFNYDGRVDVVATSFVNGTVGVLLGSGDGRFSLQSPVVSALGSPVTAREIEAGDFDGDGILDFMVMNESGSTLGLFKGRGNGSFDPGISIAVSVFNPGRLTLGDLNNDGVIDVSQLDGGSGLIKLTANTVRASTLERMNLTTRADALAALSTIDSAIMRVQRELGTLGAAQSRVSVAIANLRAAGENSEQAASRISDADVASESANLIRRSILQQAAASVLSQANQAPQIALSLLTNI